MSHWTFTATWPMILIGVGIGIIAAWLSLHHWRRHQFRRSIGILETLRFLIIVFLALTLLKPERVRQIERTEKPTIVVLHDESNSMTTSDVVVSRSLIPTSSSPAASLMAVKPKHADIA